jgi:hypothetical protein
MKKLEILNEDLLKNWTTDELFEAMVNAQEMTLELNPTSGAYQMWLMRQLAYADELNRRATKR